MRDRADPAVRAAVLGEGVPGPRRGGQARRAARLPARGRRADPADQAAGVRRGPDARGRAAEARRASRRPRKSRCRICRVSDEVRDKVTQVKRELRSLLDLLSQPAGELAQTSAVAEGAARSRRAPARPMRTEARVAAPSADGERTRTAAARRRRTTRRRARKAPSSRRRRSTRSGTDAPYDARRVSTGRCFSYNHVRGRGVAQFGSAPEWGSGGRWFESSRPDQTHSKNGESRG